MNMSIASLGRASQWLLSVSLSAALTIGCSGGSTQSASGDSPAGSAPPTPSPQEPDDPLPSDPDPSPEDPTPSDPGPATDTVVSLTWQPNSDPVAGYIVYYGPAPESANILAVQLALEGDPFGGGAPHVAFNAGRDLSLNHGDTVCFRLRAYNSANVLSDWSAAACGTI